MIKLLIIFCLISTILSAREIGQTEITTEEGIEVYQKEKYYLLKKNVEIFSDDLELKGQLVKIFFEKDLYDIKELIASENVEFISELYNLRGKGNNVKFIKLNGAGTVQTIYLSYNEEFLIKILHHDGTILLSKKIDHIVPYMIDDLLQMSLLLELQKIN